LTMRFSDQFSPASQMCSMQSVSPSNELLFLYVFAATIQVVAMCAIIPPTP
jgi:hypothetical protein